MLKHYGYVPLAVFLCGLVVAAVTTSSASAKARSLAFNSERVDEWPAGAGLRWSWPELGVWSASPWGWQRFDRVDEFGVADGSWTVRPPDDMAAQLLTPAQLAWCERAFERGATSCAVTTEGLEVSLSDLGVRLTLQPSKLRALLATADPSATRAVGTTVEWIEGKNGRMDLGFDVGQMKKFPKRDAE